MNDVSCDVYFLVLPDTSQLLSKYLVSARRRWHHIRSACRYYLAAPINNPDHVLPWQLPPEGLALTNAPHVLEQFWIETILPEHF